MSDNGRGGIDDTIPVINQFFQKQGFITQNPVAGVRADVGIEPVPPVEDLFS